jgi:hypothetical protein
MEKTMRCPCGRQRTVALDRNFRTVLLCTTCDEVERAEPGEANQSRVAGAIAAPQEQP